MAEAGWTPTVDNYLGRVTKPRIIEAVREAKGDATAMLIEHLKKGDMAREAERLLKGTGWLPEPLRLPVIEPGEEDIAELPDFLALTMAMPNWLRLTTPTRSLPNEPLARGGSCRPAPHSRHLKEPCDG
jgi:hypothetical protein